MFKYLSSLEVDGHTIRPYPEIATYSRFVLTLDLLFAMGAIELREGLIARAEAA